MQIWKCFEQSRDDAEQFDANVDCLEESVEDESIDEEYIPRITHSVIFKCIGVLTEKRYQEILALSSRNWITMKPFQSSCKRSRKTKKIRMQ